MEAEIRPLRLEVGDRRGVVPTVRAHQPGAQGKAGAALAVVAVDHDVLAVGEERVDARHDFIASSPGRPYMIGRTAPPQVGHVSSVCGFVVTVSVVLRGCHSPVRMITSPTPSSLNVTTGGITMTTRTPMPSSGPVADRLTRLTFDVPPRLLRELEQASRRRGVPLDQLVIAALYVAATS